MRGRVIGIDPPVDIYQSGNHEIVMKAEPGMRPDDIKVTVDENTLTIKGEKRLTDEVKEDRYQRIERCYGSFSRSFSLPPNVDASKLAAEYKDGILTVRIPLREEAKPRQIEVRAAA